MLVLFFLTSGLFLGWSLGANDAANVFGTAVGSRMVRFTTAALVCSVFVVLGAVVGGAGGAHTLGKLGAVNALGGAFMTALAAGLTVFAMTRLKLPVSTSQAIVGAIIGWNFFTGRLTDTHALGRIVSTWVLCPLLSAGFAVVFYVTLRWLTGRLRPHMIWEDMGTRWALLLIGAFGSYSLGANNIANVMGVFVPVAPFGALALPGGYLFSGTQQLFLLGGLAIALGVFTYSRRVMETVGGSLFRLTPQMALVVVLAQSVVLFLFASSELEAWLLRHGLPALPLVPVSSSQAVIGAVLGLGLLKGGRNIRYRVLGEIAAGWVTTPVVAGLVAFMALFFLQNVFAVPVVRDQEYELTPAVIEHLESEGLDVTGLDRLTDGPWPSPAALSSALRGATELGPDARARVAAAAEVDHYLVSAETIENELDPAVYGAERIRAVRALSGRAFRHGWALLDRLEALEPAWRVPAGDSAAARLEARDLRRLRTELLRTCRAELGEAVLEI